MPPAFELSSPASSKDHLEFHISLPFLVDRSGPAVISIVSMSLHSEQLEDGRLVERTLGGDRAAFEELYDRHRRRLRVVVSCATGDASAVDDLIQECFLRAYRKLDELQPREKSVRGWWELPGWWRARSVAACFEIGISFPERHRWIAKRPSSKQNPGHL